MRANKYTHFLDSNVVLYLLSADARKADKVESLLTSRPVTSVQVLNEVTQVCRRKLQMEWSEIAQFLALVRGFCKVVPLTEAVHDRARQIAEHSKLSFYDASIVASAILGGCDTLYSEDMNNGQVIESRLTLRNPFA